MELVAKKAGRYSTRAVKAGDRFTIPDREAKILVKLGRAAEYVPPVLEPLDDLRQQAEALGIAVDGRWKHERLQKAIDEAKAGSYQRRDMRAED